MLVEQMTKTIEDSNDQATKLEVAVTAAKTAIAKAEKDVKKDTKAKEKLAEELGAKEKEGAELLEAAGDGT